MALEKYVVLRTPSISVAEFGPRLFGTAERAAREEPTAIQIATPELSRQEAGALRRDPEVLSFAPVMPLKLHQPIEADSADEQEATWGVQAVGADTSPFDGRGVTVAVLDTGIDEAHPAFAGATLLQEDFTGEGNGDKNGHGTHCAGTIFGKSVNNLRIGVAPGVERALIGKVLAGDGSGSTEGIVKAIEWALNEGANVISMSLGVDFPGAVQRIRDCGVPEKAAISIGLETYRANVHTFDVLAALARARSQGTVIVAATGNESNRPEFVVAVAPPAAAKDIQSVGALGPTPQGLEVAEFSNTKADVAAPGVAVHSAWPGGGLRSLSGTSMATPHVAGVAALWADKLLRRLGQLSTNALTANLIASGTYTPLTLGFDPSDVGTGIVQAPQA